MPDAKTSPFTAGTVEEMVAEAISTAPRPSPKEFGALDLEARQQVARAAHRRAEVMSVGARAGLLDTTVLDSACRDRIWSLTGFIRHCADVQHDPAQVHVITEDHPARDLARQGESRTATEQSQW